MNVKIVYGGWLKAPNGASSVVRTICSSYDLFKKHGIELSYLSMDDFYDKFDNTVPSFKSKNLKIKIRDTFNMLAKFLPGLAYISIYLTFLRHAKRVTREYEKNVNPQEILFLHDIFTAYYLSDLIREQNLKVLLMLHTNGDSFSMLRIYYPCIEGSWVMKKLLKMESKVLSSIPNIGFVCDASVSKFKLDHPQIKNRIVRVYNGIEDNLERTIFSDSQIIRLVTVGTLSDRKGQFRVIQAIKKLVDEGKNNYHLLIVGGGEHYSMINNYILENNLEKYVEMTGSQSDVVPYLCKSNVFILASKDEGLPISIMEAMRAQLPVISTKVAGIPEMIIHEKSGLLSYPDIEDIYNSLVKLLEFDLFEMGKASRELFLKLFTKDIMINNYSEIIRRL